LASSVGLAVKSSDARRAEAHRGHQLRNRQLQSSWFFQLILKSSSIAAGLIDLMYALPRLARRLFRNLMKDGFIRVTQRRDKMWSVLRGPRNLSLLAFTIKSHAVAYARAISSSGKLALFVDNANGIAIRQSSSSLTYPIVLD
jgi:hypothetical protein